MIHGARLRQVRELRRLTQRAVQVEVGVNQARWSAAERDSYDLGQDALERFADLTAFPVEYFCIAPRTDLGRTPVHFRSQATVSRADLRQAERGGEVVAEAALSLLDELEGPPLSLETNSTASCAVLAAQVREAFNLQQNEPVGDLIGRLEQSGVLVLAVPGAATKKDAFSAWIEDVPVIMLLEASSGDRQLWSLAHELAHLLCHRDVGASRQLEGDADEFASHFLVPPTALDASWPTNPTLTQLALLKRQWGVSIASLVRSAHRSGRIDDDKYRSLFKQMSARGERLRERSWLPPTKPRGFRAMCEALYGASPGAALARRMNWSADLAREVLDCHATIEELPRREISNVVELRAAQ